MLKKIFKPILLVIYLVLHCIPAYAAYSDKSSISRLEPDVTHLYIVLSSMSVNTGCTRNDFYLLTWSDHPQEEKLYSLLLMAFAANKQVSIDFTLGNCTGDFVKINSVRIEQ